MILTEPALTEPLSLTNCDREPIHIPGLIQAHGVLFVLSDPELNILQVSNNTTVHLSISPLQLLGQPLSVLLSPDDLNQVQSCLEETFEQVNPLTLRIEIEQDMRFFQGILHRSPQNYLILELEPAPTSVNPDFFKFYDLTKTALTRIQKTKRLSEMCNVLVQEIRKITGFDRVMVYQFAEDGSGTVIAEDKQDELEAYLGLHYPDTDIPKQAKKLYTLNWLRLIPDVNYQPIPIVSLAELLESSSSETPVIEPLDLSFSTLRSVSPIHIEYLKNMGVFASMSISLIKDNQLWGLIACHHQSPKFVAYDIRTTCEFLGQAMSLEIASKEEQENLDYKIYLRSIQSQFTDVIAQASSITDALLQNQENLLNLVKAEGAVIVQNDHLMAVGKTPKDSELEDLILWLMDQFNNNIFVTNSLPELYPPASDYKDVASGLLAISITKLQKNFVLWFRPEQLQSVTWAGNPDKPKRLESDGSLTIFPRQSFKLWEETVQNKSLPWQLCEVEGAIELRSVLVGILLRKADELAAINLELERSNSELDSFVYIASHDLKEPLRGIHNYSTFLLEDYTGVLDEEGISKLETLVRLTKRMEDLINSLLHFSRLGRQELHLHRIDLNGLIPGVAEVFRMTYNENEIEIKIPRSFPMIRGDKILIQEVFTNLISNGFKYNNNPKKWVEIGYLDPEHTSDSDSNAFLTLYIKDNGIGIPEKHHDTIFRIFKRLHAPGKYGGGTGAGLTIVKKIIERHGGTIWVQSAAGIGSTFYFTFPL